MEDAINKIFRKFSLVDKANSQGKGPEDYVLKATGFREFLLPNKVIGNTQQLTTKTDGFKLIDYDYIRKCISKKMQIELTLVDVSELREKLKEGLFLLNK